jgi:hypothetical protein
MYKKREDTKEFYCVVDVAKMSILNISNENKHSFFYL